VLSRFAADPVWWRDPYACADIIASAPIREAGSRAACSIVSLMDKTLVLI